MASALQIFFLKNSTGEAAWMSDETFQERSPDVTTQQEEKIKRKRGILILLDAENVVVLNVFQKSIMLELLYK